MKCPARLLLDWVSFSVSLVQVFGKTMENVRKRVDVGCSDLTRRKKSFKYVARPTFARQEIFNEHSGRHSKSEGEGPIEQAHLRGMSVLDLSKAPDV